MENLSNKKIKFNGFNYYNWLVFLILYLTSCSRYTSEELKNVYKMSGANKKEIENVITFFSEERKDSLKSKAAIYIIENMLNKKAINDPIYDQYCDRIMQHKMPIDAKSLDSLWYTYPIQFTMDLMHLKGHHLIQHIEEAFAIRDSVIWGKHIPITVFKEYVLPYKVLDEKFIPGLRKKMYEKYKHLLIGTKSPEDAYVKVLSYLKRNTKEANSNFSYNIDALTMDYLKRGNCSQLNIYFISVLRSLCIPVAYDYIEHWGNYSLVGHSWISYIDNTGTTLTLANRDSVIRQYNRIDASYFKEYYYESDIGYNISQYKTVPKIYRHPYKSNKNSINSGSPKIDVSVQYGITDSVSFIAQYGDERASLSIFLTGGDWEEFTSIGVDNKMFTFKNLGKNIMYLPVFYKKSGEKKVGTPFYINDQGQRIEFNASRELELVKLKRKYPLFGNWTDMWNRMVGGVIEVSDEGNFVNPTKLYRIEKLPIGTLSIDLHNPLKIKYIRYVCPPACRTPIAEFCLYDHFGNKIEIAKVLGQSIPVDQLGMAFDNDELTSASTKKEAYWIGAALKSKQQQISRIELVPKNDGNFINKYNVYNLYYFNKKWISLGKKEASDRFLQYDNVPKGAVLLLKNLTGGKEERIFTIKDSLQIFW